MGNGLSYPCQQQPCTCLVMHQCKDPRRAVMCSCGLCVKKCDCKILHKACTCERIDIKDCCTCDCRPQMEEKCDKCGSITGRASYYTQEQYNKLKDEIKTLIESNDSNFRTAMNWKRSSEKWQKMFFNVKADILRVTQEHFKP